MNTTLGVFSSINSKNKGTVSAKNTEIMGEVILSKDAGGFVGFVERIWIETSSNEGSVSSDGGNAGGFFGTVEDDVTIEDSANHGSVAAIDGNACGFGFMDWGELEIINSQNMGTVTSTNGKTYDQVGD